MGRVRRSGWSPSDDRPGDNGGHSALLMFTTTLSGSHSCVSATPRPNLLAWVPCRKKLYGSQASFRLAYPCQASELISLLSSCLGLDTPCFLEEASSKGPSSVLPHASTKTPAGLPSWVPLPIIPQSCYLALTFPRDTSSVPLPLSEPFTG